MNTALGFSEPLVADTPLPFPEQCARIHDRIAAFLEEDTVSDRVKSVQEQTRIALGVIDEALGQYRWVVTGPGTTRELTCTQSTRTLSGLQWRKRLPCPLDIVPLRFA